MKTKFFPGETVKVWSIPSHAWLYGTYVMALYDCHLVRMPDGMEFEFGRVRKVGA